MEDSFWARVKRLIKAHKISQAKFAEYIGLTARTLWGWIYHDRIPDAATACSIAEDKMHRTFNRKNTAAFIQKLAYQIGEETKQLNL